MISHFRPVYDERGEPLLYDIWIDGVWHGSRRTEEYATDYLNHVSKKVLTNGNNSRTIDSART